MISPSAEQRIRERLSIGVTVFGRTDIETLLSLLASQDRALEEAQRERDNDQHVWERRIDDAQAERDAYRRNAPLAERKRADDLAAQLTAAQAEIARLKAVEQDYRDLRQSLHGVLGEPDEDHDDESLAFLLQARAEQAEAERASLVEALRTYGHHHATCAVRSTSQPTWPECNCGFSAALSTPVRPSEDPQG